MLFYLLKNLHVLVICLFVFRRLSLYPKGNAKSDVNDHISLYLVIANTEDLGRGWEVFVSFKFFVFDHIRDKFLTIEGNSCHAIGGTLPFRSNMHIYVCR